MSHFSKSSLCAALVVVLALTLACKHKPVRVASCSTGTTITIYGPDSSGFCDVSCGSININKGDPVTWAGQSASSSFTVSFSNSLKPKHSSSCTPGSGTPFGSSSIPVSGNSAASSGASQSTGCYEYTISHNSTTCNDPNVIIR